MADEQEETQQTQGQSKWDWYEVRVEGYFNPDWFNRMDGWKITPLPNGTTLLTCRVIDQPALHGIFAQLRDMNIKIIGVNKIG